jgi:diguanylate cyclase (GGDEF)-like protein
MNDSAGPTRDENQVATQRLKQLVAIGIALTSERELSKLLERIVGEARRLANAEAGMLFLRDGDVLRFAVAHNDGRVERASERALRRHFATEPLTLSQPLNLSQPSLPGYVALTGRLLNLPNADSRVDRAADGELDALFRSQTGSVLVVPLQEPKGEVIGVLQLVNARDAAAEIVPFEPELESVMQALASQAAVAIRNARLEELSFKDPLTGVYNRRYFAQRIEEEGKRHARFGEPLSLVLMDLDRFKAINDKLGHHAGDDTLREVAQLIAVNSRSFSVVTRYGGDEFAVLLVNTPKAGAVTYARRIRDVIERHRFVHGSLTVSVGIASLPDDVTSSDGLVPAADRALYAAKRLGRNVVEVA